MAERRNRWKMNQAPVVLRRRKGPGGAEGPPADPQAGDGVPRRDAMRLALRSVVATAFVLFVGQASAAATATSGAGNATNIGDATLAGKCSNAENNNCTGVNVCTTADPNSCVIAFNSCTGESNTCEGENSNTCQSGHGSNDCSGGASNTCTGDKSNTCTGGPSSNDCTGDGSKNVCNGDPANFCHTYGVNSCSGGASNTCSTGWTEDGDVCTIVMSNSCKGGENTTTSEKPKEADLASGQFIL